MLVPFDLSFFILRFFVFYKHFAKYEYSECLYINVKGILLYGIILL